MSIKQCKPSSLFNQTTTHPDTDDGQTPAVTYQVKPDIVIAGGGLFRVSGLGKNKNIFFKDYTVIRKTNTHRNENKQNITNDKNEKEYCCLCSFY